MRDYLEELLELLPPEGEEDALPWALPAPLLPRSPAAGTQEDGSWEVPSFLPAPEQGGGALPHWEMAAAPEGGGQPEDRDETPQGPVERERSEPALSPPRERQTASRPVGREAAQNALLGQLLRLEQAAAQAPRLEGAAGQTRRLAAERRERAWSSPFSDGERAAAPSPSGGTGTPESRFFSLSDAPAPEEQALLVDRAFQRDSRRYDRGFSLY